MSLVSDILKLSVMVKTTYDDGSARFVSMPMNDFFRLMRSVARDEASILVRSSHGETKVEIVSNGTITSPMDSAIAWLRRYLSDGPREAKQVIAAAREAGHARATLQRAANRVPVHRETFGPRSRWSLTPAASQQRLF